jgi:ribosomal protein L31
MNPSRVRRRQKPGSMRKYTEYQNCVREPRHKRELCQVGITARSHPYYSGLTTLYPE